MGDTAVAKKTAGRRGWKVIGALALGAFVAIESGWAGFGWAELRAAVYPSDVSLLGWVPGDTPGIAVVDPHLVDRKAVGAEGSTLRTSLERTRDDVRRATGIDLAFDVDKLVFSPSLVVARGRFDRKKLETLLAEHHYAVAEHEGERYLVRAGEDAIAVVDGSVLLYGDEPSLEAAIDAHKNGTSLEKKEEVTARLDQVGWNHALVVTLRMNDDQPSLRAILLGGAGPRAITVAVSTPAGLDVDAVVETPSPSIGAELAKLLDEQRKNAEALGPVVGSEVAPILVDIAKKATIAANPQTGAVKAHVHVDPAQLETLAKSARTALPLAAMYKTMRLAQLLGP